MLMTQTDAFLAELDAAPDAPWTLYNQPTNAANMAAGFLGELLLHGQDLGRLTNTNVTIDARQANAIIGQQMAMAPSFVDPAKARKYPGTYHVRFRGGDEFTYRLTDGELTVELGRPDRADCRIVGDPVAFVLVSVGRMSPVRAGLTGKMMAYGRKPWLSIPLGKIKVDGV